MVPGVEATVTGIVVVPFLVVDRNSHFGRVSVVQTITAPIVFLPPEILGVVDVRVVIEAVPVAEIGLSAPTATVRPLVRRSALGQGDVAARQHGGDQKMTKHHCVPPRDV